MNNEKQSLILGLVSGVAAVSLLALIFLGTAYFKELNKEGDERNTENNAPSVVENKPSAPKPAPTQPEPAKQKALEVKINPDDNIRGNENAPITVVEFSDAQCPYCGRFHSTMKRVMEEYPDDVRWVYKHFPLDSIHPLARKAGEAQECAGEQDKFWEYSDLLFANQSSINEAYFSKLAGEIDLDINDFDACLESGKFAQKVSDDLKYGQQLGVRGTPGNFINGVSIPGAVPFNQVKATIDSLLK